MVLSAHLYAKELTVSVDVRDIFGGTALKVLSSESYINRLFLMVRSMKFLFSVPSAPEQQAFIAVTLADTESNISAFVEQVKHITPMSKKISILLLPQDNGPHFPVHQLNSLVT
ncbi:hypothetical protein GGI17_000478 [Coemansia sp. S146]|nr:hypothetical protein GGI17_000478 [Coemansia sp. S146]